MTQLAREISNVKVMEGEAALWWLAQAGFVFKTSTEKVIYLDAYLSNVVEKTFGFKRLSLAPIQAEEVRADWVISSHEHLDHLDIESIPIIARNCPECQFAGSSECMPEFEKMGIPREKVKVLEPGKQYSIEGIIINTARSDHGDLSPTALSLLLEFGQIRVLFTGDTSMNIPLIQPLIGIKPDILIPCINGRFGNLNGEEAAELTAVVKPRVVIPCHYWMFKEHNGDPESFAQACARQCPDVKVLFLSPGEGIILKQETCEPIQLGM